MPPLRKLALPLLAGVGLVWMAGPATAQTQEIVVTGKKVPLGYEPVSKAVKIGDLNLLTAGGVQEMEKRVASAIAEVCPAPASNSPNYERQDYDVCRTFASDGSREQMEKAIAAARASQKEDGSN